MRAISISVVLLLAVPAAIVPGAQAQCDLMCKVKTAVCNATGIACHSGSTDSGADYLGSVSQDDPTTSSALMAFNPAIVQTGHAWFVAYWNDTATPHDLDIDISVNNNSALNFHGAMAAHGHLAGNATLATGGPDTFCYVDDDADSTYDTSEVVYLEPSCGTIAAGDVRIANPAVASVGSQVHGGQPDVGGTTTATGMATNLAYFDFNGDARFTAAGGDILILDHDGGGTVTIADIILSGADAGKVVGATYVHLNSNLVSTNAGTLRFADVDGSTSYTLDDVVYYDDPAGLGGAGAGQVSSGDVQLSGTGFGHVVGKMENESVFTATFSFTVSPGFSGTTSLPFTFIAGKGTAEEETQHASITFVAIGPSGGGMTVPTMPPTGGGGPPTPAIGALVLVLVLAVAAFVRRRRLADILRARWPEMGRPVGLHLD